MIPPELREKFSNNIQSVALFFKNRKKKKAFPPPHGPASGKFDKLNKNSPFISLEKVSKVLTRTFFCAIL